LRTLKDYTSTNGWATIRTEGKLFNHDSDNLRRRYRDIIIPHRTPEISLVFIEIMEMMQIMANL
jgi:hypothetical protein